MSDLEEEMLIAEANRRGISVTMLRMLRVADTSVIQGIVGDHVGKRDVTQPASMAATPTADHSVHQGSGWAPERPIRPPEGIDHIDRLCEAEAERERRRAILDAAMENEFILRQQQRLRDHELDPCNWGHYKSKDELDRGE
jgi:hypothetical protein